MTLPVKTIRSDLTIPGLSAFHVAAILPTAANSLTHLGNIFQRKPKYRFVVTLVLTAAFFSVTGFQVPAAGTDTQGVTIAVTGDITRDAKPVSDMILAHSNVSAVLLVGDTINTGHAPLEEYQRTYQGTYGRFLSKIFPCPGNHDALSEPPFIGYITFWGKAAHAPEMYYSFDLGRWHIISLDSQTFAKGGDAAAVQLEWLKADLAASSNVPVLTYWHHPFFSRAVSRRPLKPENAGAPPKKPSKARRYGSALMKPFWDAIYAHGSALVMNGHDHLYQRYDPLDPEGNRVDETRGIQEFVIGPGGGGGILKEESDNASGPVPAKFHVGTAHVGFFTLQADGAYSYVIKSLTREGVTGVVDTGSGNLLPDPKAEK